MINAFRLAACAALLASPAAAATLPVLNVQSFGAAGDGTTDDAAAIAAALAAAGALSRRNANQQVEVYFPAGRYIVANGAGPVIPSNVTLSGDPAAASTIVNSPAPGQQPFLMGTRDTSASWTYLAIARADDTAAHPAVPNSSYLGLPYIYLHDPAGAAALQALGVPAAVTQGYAGLPIELATGATLGNNGGWPAAPPGSDPALQLQYDNGINPAPAVLATILAADSTGKVTLAQPNRFDWGTYAHQGGETLADYYNPSGAYTGATLVSGPGWIIPAGNYHHDIDIEHLTFEVDTSKTGQLNWTYGLYIGYSRNVAVRHCAFRNMTGYYPILSIRAFNTLFEDDLFDAPAFDALTLDAGSGWTFDHNTFRGGKNPYAADANESPGTLRFVGYDEAPIDITYTNNIFRDLQSYANQPGQMVMGGVGGSYTRVADNVFDNVHSPVAETFFVNDQFVYDSNTLINSPNLIEPGSGSTGINAYNNSYTGTVPPAGGDGIDFYNPSWAPPTYFALNRGVTAGQFFYPSTVAASNTYFDGTPITYTTLIDVDGHNGWYDWIPAAGVLSQTRLASVVASQVRGRVGQSLDLTVSLATPADEAYPLYLLVSGGRRDSVSLRSFLITIPAGQSSIVLPAEVTAVRPGSVVISARPLLAAVPGSVSATVVVE